MKNNATEAGLNRNKEKGYLKHLPRDEEQRKQLIQAIRNQVIKFQKKLQKSPEQTIEEKIKILQLRLVLISSCSEMSLTRLDHLDWIFKHYCIHIFKTGKHMTFDRLQYQKVHLTMERFFLFIKDFELIIMKNNDKKQQVIDKNTIILQFKKASSNSRDLSFQQFIQLLQKLAILYYDEKEVYYVKKQRLREEKERRKQEYERKKLLRLKKKQGKNQEEQEDNPNQNEREDEEEKFKQKHKGQQNDQLIKQMINNKDIEDPNDEINKITNRYALEEVQETQTGNKSKSKVDQADDMLLLLTNQQKIEYYYKFMIKVDSVNEYRDKLTQLNLQIYNVYNKGKPKVRQTGQESMEKNMKTTEDQQTRIQQLKKKMDEKKMKQKSTPIPKPKDDSAWLKAEQEKRKKRQMKKERQKVAKQKNKMESDALLQKKLDSQKSVKEKKPQYNQKQIDWHTLGKMSIDQLRANKFNPNRYFSKDDDDKIFLDEYEGGGRPRMMSSRLDGRERNSQSVVEDVRKRLQEVEKKEKRQEKDLEKKIGQNVPIKNRF